MRYSPEHKRRTREAIVEAAGRVFRRAGYDGAGVGEIMSEAGLTHGGFYAHFDSKEDLFTEVVRRSVKDAERTREQGLEDLDGVEWAMGLFERYLSMGHRSAVEQGCPMPPLISELARTGEQPRRAFGRAFRTLVDRIAERLGERGDAEARDLATALVSMAVGGVALSRAMPGDRSAERILRACRAHARESLEHFHNASATSEDAEERV
jgi:TetR/AcrR family transcriptional repressor of nem operon